MAVFGPPTAAEDDAASTGEGEGAGAGAAPTAGDVKPGAAQVLLYRQRGGPTTQEFSMICFFGTPVFYEKHGSAGKLTKNIKNIIYEVSLINNR